MSVLAEDARQSRFFEDRVSVLSCEIGTARKISGLRMEVWRSSSASVASECMIYAQGIIFELLGKTNLCLDKHDGLGILRPVVSTKTVAIQCVRVKHDITRLDELLFESGVAMALISQSSEAFSSGFSRVAMRRLPLIL